MIKAMMEDEDGQVRAECAKCITVNSESLEFLVAKTQDIDPMVRKEIYDKLKAQCDALAGLNVTRSMRINLLYNGLTDPKEEVSTACVNFLRHWLLK